ncbi:MAG: hypothetical protein RIS79_3965 [Verrucomicrobiota bacterium]
MKPFLLILSLGLASGITASAQSYTDIDVSNQATIGAAIHLGSVQLGTTSAAGTSYGQRMEVTQQAEEVMQSYTIPGYYQDSWVTVEDWGWIDLPGYLAPQYSWGIVGEDYFPPVVDENGVEIAAGYWVPRYGDVYMGDTWCGGTTEWGITGTHQENFPTWVPDELVSYSEIRYDAPVIHHAASRSDTNWVWEVPDGSGSMQKVMRLWNGGLALPLPNGDVKMTLSPTSLFYTSSTALNASDTMDKVVQMNAEGITHTTTVNALGLTEESKMEARPELVRLTRRDGDGTLGQTQIAAKSAAFGGVVEVAGDLMVQGALRVPQRGDISMGEFTNGPQP